MSRIRSRKLDLVPLSTRSTSWEEHWHANSTSDSQREAWPAAFARASNRQPTQTGLPLQRAMILPGCFGMRQPSRCQRSEPGVLTHLVWLQRLTDLPVQTIITPQLPERVVHR